MKTVIMYSSAQIDAVKQTGGVKRFKELLWGICRFCNVIICTGDEKIAVPENAKHLSMHQNKIKGKEYKYAIHNKKYLKEIKKIDYDALIVFDIPAAIWLSIYRMKHIILMIRKDLFSYKEVDVAENRKAKISLKKYIGNKILKLAELITITQSEKIIVQCEYDKRAMLKRHGFFKKRINSKIYVQINNVNPSWAKNQDTIDYIPHEDSIFRVGCVNNFNDLRKGCDLFLQSIHELVEDGYPIEGYIAGDGILLDQFKAKYSFDPNIYFSGRVDNGSEYLKKFHLAVVPSRADSCPNTVMEAFINDVPVIASNVGGIPEIVTNEEALFTPTVSDLKNRIIYCMEKKNIEKILSEQTKRKQELKFDWSKRIFEIIFGSITFSV